MTAITVTGEMVEAGLKVFKADRPAVVRPDDAVREIYLAMAEVRERQAREDFERHGYVPEPD